MQNTHQAFLGRCVPSFISFMRGRLQRMSARSNTAPVKPQQLHYPPEGGRGKRVGGEGVRVAGAKRVGEGGQIKRV